MFTDPESYVLLGLAIAVVAVILWPRPPPTIVSGAVVPPHDKKRWIPFNSNRGTKR